MYRNVTEKQVVAYLTESQEQLFRRLQPANVTNIPQAYPT